MNSITCIITNCGDGSNSLKWVTGPDVLDRIEALADDGDEQYASGDGLQTQHFVFPDGFDLDAWMKMNHISLTTMGDLE